jgi:hypothetical protein
LDTFTQKRILRFIEDFRQKSGQPPTLNDFESAGFDRNMVEAGVKTKVIEQFYSTLTNGTVVKTYKVRVP